jgi:site-specific DNA recombinase
VERAPLLRAAIGDAGQWPARVGGPTMSRARPGRSVCCAIYTRVSTDAGLEQEFNSLDAQYDASQAYIRSQAHAGWTLIKARYDDGGFSGGSTDRPALQQLLADVRARKINVIVVYKVDRLTRSLADFAKLVELFDSRDVFFVSVTQQFNTTTSMGRLTLNVLLSFAQFEREVTAERIRDKIAASKRKGLWVGGMVPLGYQLKDGKLSINPQEAETVRLIFKRYLELGSVNQLVRDLRDRGLRSKVRHLSTGATRGGVPFTQGPLFYILRNRFYVGEVKFKDEILGGPQPALLERSLFEAVQNRLTAQWLHRNRSKQKNQAMLSGLLFDDAGHPMVATYASKNRVRYRYYMSAPLRRARCDDPVGSVSRVPAEEIEAIVGKAVCDHLQSRRRFSLNQTDQDAVRTHVERIEVRTRQLAVHLKATGETGTIDTRPVVQDFDRSRANGAPSTQSAIITIGWASRRSQWSTSTRAAKLSSVPSRTRGEGSHRNQRINPMHLPMHLASRCLARTRRGTLCQSPAMQNGRCRMHGGTSPGAPNGNKNALKHGRYTAEAIARRRYIAELVRLARSLG